jgi:galactokinase
MQNPSQLRTLHRERYGAEPGVFVAPGRVNLIGEHTDYAEGFVMPAAIDFATLASISYREDGKVVIYSKNYDEERSFAAASLPQERSDHWTDYPLGVLAVLAGEGVAIPAFSLSIWSDVPLGSGLSSSAALEVATAVAVTSLVGKSYPGPVLAKLCQRAENEFVGASSGIMDQFISANGKKDHALLLDCRDLTYKLAHIPDDLELVIANTMVQHAVTGTEYTSRRAEVEEAAAVIASHRPEVKFLRDATLGDLEKYGSEMSPNALKRARHVISENLRTVEAAEALIQNDREKLGRLMAEAHWSYSRDFEASCVEADAMVELAQDLPGLVGARLTGGGFGGCTVNLVEAAHAAEFAKKLGERYRAKIGIVPEVHISHAAEGARRLYSAE